MMKKYLLILIFALFSFVCFGQVNQTILQTNNLEYVASGLGEPLAIFQATTIQYDTFSFTNGAAVTWPGSAFAVWEIYRRSDQWLMALTNSLLTGNKIRFDASVSNTTIEAGTYRYMVRVFDVISASNVQIAVIAAGGIAVRPTPYGAIPGNRPTNGINISYTYNAGSGGGVTSVYSGAAGGTIVSNAGGFAYVSVDSNRYTKTEPFESVSNTVAGLIQSNFQSGAQVTTNIAGMIASNGFIQASKASTQFLALATGGTVIGSVTNSGGMYAGSNIVQGVWDSWGNTRSVGNAFIGGGLLNEAGESYSVVGGGLRNYAMGANSTVGGGIDNTATGTYATVAGGVLNNATGYGATIPGGLQNNATGQYSFAAGRRAKANHNGSFVWGDSNASYDKTSQASNSFNIWASGGTYFLDSQTNVFIAISATGGLRVGVNSFYARPSGDIEQDSTNTATLGTFLLSGTTNRYTDNGTNLLRNGSALSGGGASADLSSLSNAVLSGLQLPFTNTASATVTIAPSNGWWQVLTSTGTTQILIADKSVTNLGASVRLDYWTLHSTTITNMEGYASLSIVTSGVPNVLLFDNPSNRGVTNWVVEQLYP